MLFVRNGPNKIQTKCKLTETVHRYLSDVDEERSTNTYKTTDEGVKTSLLIYTVCRDSVLYGQTM